MNQLKGEEGGGDQRESWSKSKEIRFAPIGSRKPYSNSATLHQADDLLSQWFVLFYRRLARILYVDFHNAFVE